MSGGNDPECRQCMVWDKDAQNGDLLTFYRTLIALRKENPALRSMDIRFLHAAAKDAAIVYERRCADGDRFVIAINAGERTRKLAVPSANGAWSDVFTGESVRIKDKLLTLNLPPYSFTILRQSVNRAGRA
ncbi:Neopullulanase [compost metagenome]